MAPSADELQRNRFYNENWSVAMESTFFGVLVQEITMGVAEPGYPDSYAIRRFPLAKAYEHFREPNYTALRAIFEGHVPHGVGPSRRGCNNEVIDVDAIVELSLGSDDN
ncbi:hypothetical protein Salat_2489700 [Sesamum alatum]|uniref:Uncharacterized protein n=1 Tax=Sesamum alatum TaxID=300844 RepID=A0AAE2CC30_9LAMI|nr:hypothetical protein Salat_2489700 [Sesamum alatum]